MCTIESQTGRIYPERERVDHQCAETPAEIPSVKTCRRENTDTEREA